MCVVPIQTHTMGIFIFYAQIEEKTIHGFYNGVSCFLLIFYAVGLGVASDLRKFRTYNIKSLTFKSINILQRYCELGSFLKIVILFLKFASVHSRLALKQLKTYAKNRIGRKKNENNKIIDSAQFKRPVILSGSETWPLRVNQAKIHFWYTRGKY